MADLRTRFIEDYAGGLLNIARQELSSTGEVLAQDGFVDANTLFVEDGRGVKSGLRLGSSLAECIDPTTETGLLNVRTADRTYAKIRDLKAFATAVASAQGALSDSVATSLTNLEGAFESLETDVETYRTQLTELIDNTESQMGELGLATSSNTNDSIVKRDSSGNFTSGTITAALTGAASDNVLKDGDTMTGVLVLTAGTPELPGLVVGSDPDTGLFSSGGDKLGIATGGVGRVEFGNTEVVFNGGGSDVDFRVGGDTRPNLFRVDAGLDQVQVENLNGGPLAGFRNVIINGNPNINQRGYVSGTVTSGSNQYTLDRWRVVTSGQSITFTDSANVRTVTASAGGVEQVVEGLSILSGTYTLNWTGTATATVNGTTVARGGNITLTGGTDATVRFSGGTFSLVQLEPGTIATPFEGRTIGTELALCQRYYQELTRVGWEGDATSGQTYAAWYNYSVMRTAPSVVIADVSRTGFAAGVFVPATSISYLQVEATCNSTGANRSWLAIVKLDAEL